jgi:chaperone modulatory protein CbpM
MEISGIVLDKTMKLTLNDLCKLCCVSQEEIFQMVEEGILEPHEISQTDWQFHGYELRKVQIALRLQKDLQVNLPGVAVILNLLDEIEELKKQMGFR